MATPTGADRIEIHDLFARHYVALDTHDPETWLGRWADDGELKLAEPVSEPDPSFDVVAEIRPVGAREAA